MSVIIIRTLALLLTVIISSVCPSFALGDESKEISCAELDAKVKENPTKARVILDALYGIDCLGGQKDSWELAQHVKDSLESVPKEGDLEIARTKIASELQLIRNQLQKATLNIDATLLDANSLAIDKFEKNDLAGIGPHKPKFWEYHTSDGKIEVGIDVNRELEACKDAAKESDCLQGYLRAKQLVSYATVTKRALDYFSMREVHALAIHVNMLEKRWEHYFNDSRSQFFWELGLNGYIYGKTNKGKKGLLSPPDYQIILLHPSVGLEYVDTKAGDRFRETIVLEGIGLNKWTWNDSTMKLPLGISVIGIYGDRSSVPQIGYGALIHINNNLSLGVTRRGSETGAILSLDLAKLFLKQDENKKYEFKYRVP